MSVLEEQFVAQGDPDYLVASRRAAMVSYEAQDVPKYERSDLSRRPLEAFTVACGSPRDTWRALASTYMTQDETSPLLVIADGKVVLQRGLDSLLELGVTVTSLRQAAHTHQDLVQSHLLSVVPTEENRFMALSGALWRDGAFVHVPKDVQLAVPIQVICVTTAGGHGTFPRNLIIAEPHSSLTFLDVYVADSTIEDELRVGVTEVIAKDGAHVKVGSVHDFPRKATNILVHRATVARDATMNWVVGEMSEGFTVSEFGSQLVGEGSRSTSHAIALGTGRSHLDMTAKMVHIGRSSESDTVARGVMQGKANAVYRGWTQIEKGASGANGQQAEKLLMLSPQSRADAIPMLLIDENDVLCGHAASVGQMSEEQLFYLMSRGITPAAAKQMVVWGFMEPVLQELAIDIVRRAVEAALERKMA